MSLRWIKSPEAGNNGTGVLQFAVRWCARHTGWLALRAMHAIAIGWGYADTGLSILRWDGAGSPLSGTGRIDKNGGAINAAPATASVG